MKTRANVLIGMLGPVVDAGKGTERWERWRPSVAVCQHDDLVVGRFELLYEPKFKKLAELVQEDVQACSPETQVRLHELPMADPWDFEEVYASLHDFARGYAWKTEQEEYLVHMTTGSHVAQICWFLLAEAKFVPGKLLQTSPPGRGKEGTPGEFRVIDLDLSRYDRIARRFEKERKEGVSFLKSGIETKNAKFNALVSRIESVAISSKAPLLLMGPTGAGKSHLARKIFELKKNRRQVEGSFIEVNCATLRGDAAMSALFGHVKGAFTGAMSDRPGLLRAADGGVLFLDEIGELGVDEQAMLLRALEEKRFLPVGSDKEARSEFQLIGGTNRDLAEAVGAGTFREDLLSRINLWTFRLPPLRERSEDIEPNLDYELEQFSRSTGRRATFNKEAREKFLSFATSPSAMWEGNFRDLSAAITRMATLAPQGRITVEVVADEIERLEQAWRGPHDDGGEGAAMLVELLGQRGVDELDLFDRIQLEGVLAVCAQCKSLSEAGRSLFAVSREARKIVNDADRLRKYLARFRIEWGSIAALRA